MVTKFFCFELITAGLIVGWFGLINGIVSTTGFIILLVNQCENATNYIPTSNSTNFDKESMINILAAGLSFSVIAILTCSMLIMGTIKKNHLMLIPWLINASVSLAYAVVLLIGITIFIVANVNGDIGAAIVTLVIGTLPILLSFYTWCAIFSLYRKLKIEMIGREENQRLLQQQKNYNTSTMA